MILPNNWTKAFFHSFIFCSARLVCLEQRAQIDFEAGRPSFPRDYPTLLPATELADQQGSEEARHWASKPPAKRVNYKLVQSRGGEGGDPFVPDWNVVIDREGIQRNMRGEVLEKGATENAREWYTSALALDRTAGGRDNGERTKTGGFGTRGRILGRCVRAWVPTCGPNDQETQDRFGVDSASGQLPVPAAIGRGTRQSQDASQR